jgi:hypothetical protein
MTRSPVALARKALEIAQAALPAYSSPYSRRDFTQHQLFSVLILMTFLKTDHRGIVAILADWTDLRAVLKLTRVPHYATLFKAEARFLKKVITNRSWTRFSSTRIGRASSTPARWRASTPPAWMRVRVPRIMPGEQGKNAILFDAGRS